VARRSAWTRVAHAVTPAISVFADGARGPPGATPADTMKRYRIKPGTKVDLGDFDPDDTSAVDGKEGAKEELEATRERLEALQELLFAEHVHKVLIVLQGMDTSGKDGVIRHVFDGVNPQGVSVASFKEPTPRELDHDYLWRIHRRTPGRGEITIFNRSHYEDVLIVRVHGKISDEDCERRYRQINAFERTLAEEGTTILKFFLHVSRDEQKKRLSARLSDPEKHWKFNYTDVRERAFWDDYTRAYTELLTSTSTADAPWYVIPANKKWYRNVVVSKIIVSALTGLDMKYPKSTIDPDKVHLD
jgi:PPK2 family polyphosphate:nucleotide phosphotransferase